MKKAITPWVLKVLTAKRRTEKVMKPFGWINRAWVSEFGQSRTILSDFFTPDGLPDHLVLMFESQRRISLGSNEYFLVHFNTVNSAQGILQHYAVRIYSDATIQVSVDGGIRTG